MKATESPLWNTLQALGLDREAEGAMPKGTRIKKVLVEEGDGNPLGTTGTVLSSLGPIDAETISNLPVGGLYQEGDYFYFVEWDTMPGIPVGVSGMKIAEVS